MESNKNESILIKIFYKICFLHNLRRAKKGLDYDTTYVASDRERRKKLKKLMSYRMSQWNVATSYYNGQGVAKDELCATYWYREVAKGCVGGYAKKAKLILADMRKKRDCDSLYYD